MATIVVTTAQDDSSGPIAGQTTLRDAVAQANAGDTITFAQSFISQTGTFGAGNTIKLGATLEITAGKTLIIDGDVNHDGAVDVLLEDNNNITNGTLLRVDAGATATLRNLVLTNPLPTGGQNGTNGLHGANGTQGFQAQDNNPTTGRGPGGSGFSATTSGTDGSKGSSGIGGIDNHGALTLSHVALTGFEVVGGKGGAGGDGGAGGSGGDGDGAPVEEGGIYTQPGTNGGSAGSGTNAGNGAAGGDAAGAIYNAAGATLTLSDVVLARNTASAGNGGAGGTGGYGGDGGDAGGGITLGTPGNAGNGANGGNGGNGGNAGGAVLNSGFVKIQGLTLIDNNSATAGTKGALGGAGGGGIGGGYDFSGGPDRPPDGQSGTDGSPGVAGLGGTAGADFLDLGTRTGATAAGNGIAGVVALTTTVDEGTDLPSSNPWSSSVHQPDTVVTFAISRLGDLSAAATIHWAVNLDASAQDVVNAADFKSGTALSGTATFAANSTLATVSFTVVHDAVGEKDEKLRIDLSTPSAGLVLGAATQATTTIRNDDGTPDPDNLHGTAFPDQIDGLASDDTLDGGDGPDRLFGGIGNDTLIGGGGGDALIGGVGGDSLQGGDGKDIAIYETVVTVDLLTPSANKGEAAGDTYSSIENVAGSSGNDTIKGDNGDNILDGGPPDFSQLLLDFPAFGQPSGKDTLFGRGGNDTILAGDDDDFVDGGAGNDTLDGDTGHDTVSFATAAAGVTVVLNGFDPEGGSNADGGTATGDGNDTLFGFEDVEGSNHDDTITGNKGPNKLSGLDGNDKLNGGEGDDTLLPGKGNDTLDGGAGTDTVDYAKASSAVTANLGTGLPAGAKGTATSTTDGTDTITNVENIIGSDFKDNLTGDSHDNRIESGKADDILAGGLGTNILDGGAGNDTVSYEWDTTVGVFVTLASDSGGGPRGTSIDPTPHAISDTLKDIENITGSGKGDELHGDGNANRLKGGDGDDFLTGGGGDDTLDGGAGTGRLNAKGDWVDYGRVTSAVTVSLAAGTASGDGSDTLTDIENVQGSATLGSNITGDDKSNELRGGSGADVIDGGGDDDEIYGGAGKDILYGGAGDDILGKVPHVILGKLSVLILTNDTTGDTQFFGGDGKDLILAGSGNDIVHGDADNDLIKAGAGDDHYDGGDGIDELDYDSAGLTSGITLSLADGTATGGTGSVKVNDTILDIELVGGTIYADKLTGDAHDNLFVGLKGDDTLDGGGGNDQLFGNEGDDTYLFRVGTQIFEKLDEGHDTVRSSLNYILGDNVEDLVLEGTKAINGTGNALNNTITGNGKANVLDGGAGNDTLFGSIGDDTLKGGTGDDHMNGGDGSDTADWSDATGAIAISLPDSGDATFAIAGLGTDTFTSIENVIGSAFNDQITGNGGDNKLMGGAGFDTLVGGLGNDDLDGGANPEGASGQGDIMLGGGGNDTYHVDSGLDFVDEGIYFPSAGFGGTDTIISTTDFYWDIASVGEIDQVAENVVDAGGDGVTIVGGVFDNTLIGHKGTDVLFGRGGSDTYRAGDGVDFISLSTLGVTDTSNYTADGHNTIIVDPRTSGPFSYDIVFEFDPAKDKIDVSHYTGAHDYKSAAEVLSHAVDDGAGNCYIVLGDGLDYLYLVGLEKSDLLASDFIV